MTKMINITNCETGEEIVREMTTDELASLEKIKAEAIAQAEKDKQKEITRKELFQRLGITEEEAKLLLS